MGTSECAMVKVKRKRKVTCLLSLKCCVHVTEKREAPHLGSYGVN